MIVEGRTAELKKMQKPDIVTPITSPFVETYAVIKFK
jgi:hypothetical protein